jgi:hypothetical protein
MLVIPPSHTGMLPGDINLAHNTCLRRLRLVICRDHRLAGSMECVFTLLSQIISPQMDRVSLEFSFDSLDGVDWARMERILTEQRWANLQKLLLFRRPRMRTEDVQLIRSRLPVLESRGVVHFPVEHVV